MNRVGLLILFLLLALGFFVRLYKFSEPIADWHSFRQSDTAAVSQIFAKEGYDLLYPKYYDISNVQSGLDNPRGYRFVEFPIYNLLHAFMAESIGGLSFTQWGRMLNIVASLITAVVVFALLKKYANNFAAYSGLVAFLFLPYSIFYSRVILPDVMMTTSLMLGIYFFDKFLSYKKMTKKTFIFYALSLLFISSSFLLKPFSLFFILPIIYLAYKKFGTKMFLKWYLYLFAIVSVVPLYLWRSWIVQFPEGIPVSDWLFNGNGIRFRPSFFRWIFFERVTKLILGYFGAFAIAASVFSYKDKNILFFVSFAFSSLLYLFVIATGNVQHDYYQILIIPTVVMFVGIGMSKIYEIATKKFNRVAGCLLVVIVFVLSFYFSWIQVKDYFNINDRGMVEAAEKANEILPKDALIIAPYDGSTTFLNLIQRRGWPVFQQPIEELIDKGAQYMVIANPTENDFTGFGTEYDVIDSSNTYLILKLK